MIMLMLDATILNNFFSVGEATLLLIPCYKVKAHLHGFTLEHNKNKVIFSFFTATNIFMNKSSAKIFDSKTCSCSG